MTGASFFPFAVVTPKITDNGPKIALEIPMYNIIAIKKLPAIH